MPATPPPNNYERVRRELAGVGRDEDLAELLDHADDELRERDAEIQRLRAEVERRDDQIFSLQVETEDLEAEVNRKSDALARWFASRGSGAAQPDLPAEVATVE